MTAHRARPAECVGVEAQAESVAWPAAPCVSCPQGSLPSGWSTATSGDALGRRFALVTGSPPYFPTNAGVLPQDPQRLACRFELRGGVEAYCETAAGHLLPHGRFFLVHQTACDARVLTAARGARLICTACWMPAWRRPGWRVPERLRAGV
ncbi:MAG: hypothetical protein IPH72_17865 [Sandaracinaceae bacterium]|nr:hypothetical protein [Sandaracinaceae bacterium]